MTTLQSQIESLFSKPAADLTLADRDIFSIFVRKLESGEIRSAEKLDDGSWKVNHWVKQGILVGFRLGKIVNMSGDEFQFYDKDTYPIQKIDGVNRSIRIVPGGSSIRRGSYIAKSVTCMPPMYINVGAFVDEGTMVDSHALVGSCAQIGKRVHLSAACQIGGVLEPVGALPVIIEDDVMVGGNTGIYEGTIIKKGAVIGSGVILTGGTPVYDAVNKTIFKREVGKPLTIPENAVVIQGSRPLNSEFGKEHQLQIYTPIIVKYRDEKTNASTALEDALR